MDSVTGLCKIAQYTRLQISPVSSVLTVSCWPIIFVWTVWKALMSTIMVNVTRIRLTASSRISLANVFNASPVSPSSTTFVARKLLFVRITPKTLKAEPFARNVSSVTTWETSSHAWDYPTAVHRPTVQASACNVSRDMQWTRMEYATLSSHIARLISYQQVNVSNAYKIITLT